MDSDPGQHGAANSSREKRLAEALRANLRRRKAQVRERSAAARDGGQDRRSERSGEPG